MTTRLHSVRLLGGAVGLLIACTPAFGQVNLGPQVLQNAGAEAGVSPWSGIGASVAHSNIAHEGTHALLVTDRGQTWSGVGQALPANLPPGTYEVSAWVRPTTTGAAQAMLTFRTTVNGATSYRQAASRNVPGNAWTRLRGWYTHAPQGIVSDLYFYAEGPNPGVDFAVDALSIRRVDLTTNWRAAADARIEAIRKSDAIIRVVDDRGRPVEGVQIDAEQTARSFPFGSAIAASGLDIPEYRERFTELFNWAVAENELKWYWTHPTPGANTYWHADRILQFCEANGIPLRGHCVFWAVDQYVPEWVRGLNDAGLTRAIDDRIDQIVGRYAGRLAHWDVNNEMLHGRFFADRLGEPIRAHMFRRTAEIDPGAKLFVNDYNIITSNSYFEYADQIQALLDDGASIHGIGVQGHFGASVDVPSVLAKLDVLAEFGLPIWVTEFDASAPNDAALAQAIENLYRAAYSHPSVEGILMWGFWEGRHWRPESAIVDMDWTLNAAGERYVALLNEWTTSTGGVTDAQGSFTFRGFHGTYEIACEVNGDRLEGALTLEPNARGELTLVVPGVCRIDLDDDGSVNVSDLLAFLGAFRARSPIADWNADGSIGVNDLLAYLSDFRARC